MEKIGAIADTGFVVALLNRKDRQHVAVATIYQQHPTIALPQPALTEIAYLLGRDAGIPTVVQFLRSLDNSRFKVISGKESQPYNGEAHFLERTLCYSANCYLPLISYLIKINFD
ncbi:MAG: hypothetical protein P5702_23935 [Limnospira sp. PMC 1291.21]|uniref:PIN domain-containing protein n=2 Tax=Limnospira fusiformis TaxID=54297 RepID=A0ABU9EMB6_LIMFS|nr:MULTISPECIES: hypothetical protein [Limnospira]MDT9178413.1 hypothetical protein [Limnospira sp. PMC 1238.20]MDT9188228.1 hypothetical protein [Limnospira sp. PMC 894.15]MDT9193048.1 hypothetical protein [Limnospira sp. PMC 1245.20]MDT9199964.1 hypothetical protein [Limnospira sp. PMC 1042.18]MDT9205832.1 hypothetical protein [Limnospira sp. PMC 1243.20]